MFTLGVATVAKANNTSTKPAICLWSQFKYTVFSSVQSVGYILKYFINRIDMRAIFSDISLFNVVLRCLCFCRYMLIESCCPATVVLCCCCSFFDVCGLPFALIVSRSIFAICGRPHRQTAHLTDSLSELGFFPWEFFNFLWICRARVYLFYVTLYVF